MTITGKLALGSVVVSLVVLGVKSLAYGLTGSVALLSDALESIVNVATALAAVWALRVAEQPADDNHPYGHSKAEYLSAVAEGVLIVGAAIVIFEQAVAAILHPEPLSAPVAGLMVGSLATILNAVWSSVLQVQGKKHLSPALLADGKHIRADVVTSIGVVVGVALVFITGIQWLDAALAALVALHVLWSGWALMRESVGGLMDEALSATTLARVHAIIARNATGAIEAHDIKTRYAGKLTFIEFHLVVPSAMRVAEAHDICDRIEQELKSDMPHSAVSIHVEPEHKRKHSGVLVR